MYSAIKSFFKTARGVFKRAARHNMTVASAGIAFYGLLALVPTLIALVSIYALVADPTEIESQVSEAAGSLDPDTQDFLTSQLQSIVGDVEDADAEPNSVGRWIALVAGIGLALFSASGAISKLLSTIALAYEAEETRGALKLRFLAYSFTAAALVGIAGLVFVMGLLPRLMDSSVVTVFQPIIALAGFALGMSVLYRFGPDTKPNRTPWINPGSIVAAVLFTVFTVGFSFYSTLVGAMPGSYGLLGSIAAIMIFLQLAAIAVILGAETNGYLFAETTATETARRQPEPMPRTTEQIPFGKALAGLLALFVLNKSTKDK